MYKQTAQSLDAYIGKRLRALRVERKASLEMVAEIIEVSQQQVSRYELGHNRLSAAQLYRLARGLNVPLSWFFQGFEEKADELGRLEVALKEDRGTWHVETAAETEQALMDAWHALPTDLQRQRVLALLEAISFKV
ncbi:MAG TPA: helix-turn-helix domain-containing protein [Gammaproteobacteria bacterium]|nr:helix-turn-helix domain-containing protein [Gammaproteobacteria bacterium]